MLDEVEIDVTMVGAIGDGRSDDTASFLAAVALGRPIRVPEASVAFIVRRRIDLKTNGQTVTGAGPRSRVLQLGSGADSTLFFADGLRGVRISNLSISPGAVTDTLFNGYAVHLRGCADTEVSGCSITQHRRGGVLLETCTRAQIRGNSAGSSIVRASDHHGDAGCDILVLNGGQDIQISGNRCIGGAGQGIGVMTTASKSRFTFQNVAIRQNVIERQGMYGALIYRSNDTDRFQAIVVEDNVISDISGAIRHFTRGLVYGAGIYVQGVDDVVVRRNQVRRTNTSTRLETLAPAGIGVTNARSVELTQNLVEDCAWYGVAVFDPNHQGRGQGVARLTGNRILRSGKSGLYLKDIIAAEITGGEVRQSRDDGVLCRNVATASSPTLRLDGVSSSRNERSGFDIQAGRATFVKVVAEENKIHGLALSGTGPYLVDGGRITRTGVRGILVTPAVSACETRGVTFENNPIDILAQGRVTGLGTNRYSSAATRL